MSSMSCTTRIRPFTAADSPEQLTALLHTAYATLAAQGWNFTAALRARYQRRGYRDTGRVQWSGKTYGSVLMCKELV